MRRKFTLINNLFFWALLVLSILFLFKAEADVIEVKGLAEIRGVIERETKKELVVRVKGGKLFLDNDEIKAIKRTSKEENDILKQRWEKKEKGTQKLQKYTSKTYKIYIASQKRKGLLQYENIEIVKCNYNKHF